MLYDLLFIEFIDWLIVCFLLLLVVVFLLLLVAVCCYSFSKCETWSRCLTERGFLRGSSKFPFKQAPPTRSAPEKKQSHKIIQNTEVVSICSGFMSFSMGPKPSVP